MYYILSEHFTGIFLFLCMIRYDTLSISVYANSLNSSEEIKDIFSTSSVTRSSIKGALGTGNYAEGGLININPTTSSSRTLLKNVTKTAFTNQNVSTSLLKKENIIPFHTNASGNNIKNHSFESPAVKNSVPTKLTEIGANLFLGVPEVIHINGTSSIKPRKGVYYNKIVPRKGVESESESNHDFLENNSCFKLTEDECYNATGLSGVECNCCEAGNELGKIVKQRVVLNCTNCKPIKLLSTGKEICKNICCNAVVHDIYSGSITHDNPNRYLNYATVSELKKENKVDTDNFTNETVAEKKDILSSKKNSKHKPSLTKVPYDVEIVTELLNKPQQTVFIPIAVSIFLLPLIGILIFFIWRRTKDYWDKRYYKKMDFLIDGIYND